MRALHVEKLNNMWKITWKIFIHRLKQNGPPKKSIRKKSKIYFVVHNYTVVWLLIIVLMCKTFLTSGHSMSIALKKFVHIINCLFPQETQRSTFEKVHTCIEREVNNSFHIEHARFMPTKSKLTQSDAQITDLTWLVLTLLILHLSNSRKYACIPIIKNNLKFCSCLFCVVHS